MRHKRKFKGLLRLLRTKNESLAQEAVAAVVDLIVHAEHAPPRTIRDDLARDRMQALLKLNSPRITDVVLKMLEDGYFAAQVAPGVAAVIKRGDRARFFEALDADRITGTARNSALNAAFCCAAVFQDMSLCVDLLRRLKPEDDADGDLLTAPMQFQFGLEDALEKLLASKGKQADLITILGQSRSYSAVRLCIHGLGFVGDQQAIEVLRRAPRIAGPRFGANTSVSIEGAIDQINRRLGKQK